MFRRVAATTAAAVSFVSATGLYQTASCKVYEHCDAIGEGLRGEFWKSRHGNINVLGVENDAVKCLVTKLRDKTTVGDDFRLCLDRLLAILVEEGLSALDTEDTEVITPDGHTFSGAKVPLDDEVLGINIDTDSTLMSNALAKLFPQMAFAKLTISETGSKKFVTDKALPKDVAKRQVVLLDPLIGRGRTLEAAIKFLLSQGVEEENIVVLAISLAPEAASMLRHYKDINVVSATIESGYEKGKLVPGFGFLVERYNE